MAVLLINEVSRALSDMHDEDRMPPSSQGSYGLNILKWRRATCSANIEMVGFSKSLAWGCFVMEAAHVHLQASESFSPSNCQCILGTVG